MENSLTAVQSNEVTEKEFGMVVEAPVEKAEMSTEPPKKSADDEVIYVEDMDKDLQNHPKLFEIAKGLKELDKEYQDKLKVFAKGYEDVEISVRTIFRLKDSEDKKVDS